MAHNHGIKKIKKDSSFDCDAAYVVLQNVSNRTIYAGGSSLFPGDKAWYCGSDEKIEKLVKQNVLKTIEQAASKPKPKKVKEEKSEETSATVADVDSEASVQLGSSEDDVALNTEQ